MRSIGHFLRYEFRRFKGRSRLALVFILLIPLLYGGIYLAANWDLYDNIDQIKVAVVNDDEPATFQDMTINGGEQFAEALRDRPVFDWQFLDDRDEALDGLRHGEYFMVIRVPENFSSNLVSAGKYEPERARLELRRDDANGFIIGTLTGKAEDTLAKTLDSTVADAYFRAMFGSLDQIREGMASAADGAGKLDDGLAQAADGVGQMHDELLKATDKAKALQGNVTGIEDGFDQVGAAADEAAKGANQLRQGLGDIGTAGATVAGDLRAAAAQVDPLVDHALGQLPKLKEQVGDLVSVHGELNSDDGGLVVSLDRHVDRSVQRSKDLVAKHPELANDEDLVALVKELEATRDSRSQLRAKLDAAADLSAGLNLQLDTSGLDRAARNVQSSLDDARKSAEGIDGGLAKLNAGADTIDGGVGKARDAMQGIGANVREIGRAAPQMVDGVVRLTDGVGQLNTAMPQLSDGAHQLATGLDDGLKQLPQLSDKQQEKLAVAMSSPVDFEQTVDHDAQYYGRGLAPMFASIGMWIMTVSVFLVVRTISGRALSGRGNPFRIAATGLGPIFAIALGGAWIMAIGLWAGLGLDPVHPGLFLLLVSVASLAFVGLAYVVRLVLGSPQTAIFLVWLILQLPASGGTFPVQMLPSFFRALVPVSPMWYSVTAFRVAISGGQMSTYWMCTGVLFGVLVASVALSVWLVWRRQRFRMRDLHPPMVTSESTADFAFSVRPR
ncbi:YhgE/Pip domain-containing protein [uncultured Tessaracoccus sp.]|uniref:YhgE/Pip domain-containing protein n=1 Tax=uncultured Tessaracoccus sp. TaxID=905023 RepID=UPI0025F60312|nr:YhgE/Pip domain-containing protein [uncultured Tessaracoccus sp.]